MDPLLKAQTISIGRDASDDGEIVFRKRREAINWRLLAGANIDDIISKRDVKTLQSILENITFCDVQREEFDEADPNLIKMFQLAQLTIEYLLFCQDKIIKVQQQSQTSATQSTNSLSELKHALQDTSRQLEMTVKENRALKKTVYAFQLWSKVPGGPGSQAALYGGGGTVQYVVCEYCNKVFSSEFYLEAHLDRRHPDKPNYIRERKEEPQRKKAEEEDRVAELLTQIDRLSSTLQDRLGATESSIKGDIESKVTALLNEKEGFWKSLLQDNHLDREKELQDIKSLLRRELDDERRLLNEERIALEHSLKENLRQSNVGALEPDEEPDARFERMLDRLDQKHGEDYEKMMSLINSKLATRQVAEPDREKIDAALKKELELQAALKQAQEKIGTLESSLAALASKPKETIPEVIPEVVPERKSVPEVAQQPKELSWKDYIKKLQSLQHTPYSKFPNIKSRFSHSSVVLGGKMKELSVQVDNDAKEPQAAARRAKKLREKHQYHNQMKAFISNMMIETVDAKFEFKPISYPFMKKKSGEAKIEIKKPVHGSAVLFPDSHSLARSTNSEGSIKWDAKLSESDDESISSVEGTSAAGFDPKTYFAALYKNKEPERRDSEDPILKSTIGHVSDESDRKDPLEKRRISIEGFDMSDLSESDDGTADKPVRHQIEPNTRESRQQNRIVDSLNDLKLSTDML